MSLEKMFDLKEKVAIITGGVGLLGNEYAEALSEAGAHVVIVDLDEKKCKEKAEALSKKYKTRAIGIGTDISEEAAVQKMVELVIDKFKKIDILVNNAATKSENFFAPFEEYPLEDWNKVMSVNLTGVFLCSKAVGKQMVRQKSGVIVNISSIYGIVAPDQRIYEGSNINTPAVYSASKGAVVALTKYLASYWGAEKGIRVNCITPGGVYNNHEKDFVDKYNKRTPLGRMAKKDDFVGALLYLASNASSYVTGHNLIVDGGWTVW